MQRRHFSVTLAACGALALPGVARAQRIPKAGTDYKSLGRPVPTEAPAGKVEVVDFFWYSCPHCNAFEPQLQAWIRNLPADVALRRVPVAFRENFVPQARLFYTLDAMGKVDELHAKVFDAIHNQRQPTDRDDLVMAFAQKSGLDMARFKETYDSDYVRNKVRQAVRLQEGYEVEGVPALGTAGRWYTDGSMAGSMGRALQVTDYLIGEARKPR